MVLVAVVARVFKIVEEYSGNFISESIRNKNNNGGDGSNIEFVDK